MKDANVSQVSELRIFAKSAMYYSKDMVHLCQKAIDEVREVYSAAEFWRNMVRRKVEEAQRQLDNAQKALNDYESQNHTDEEGNSTYDYHYASLLRSAVSEAEQHLISAKSDEDNVIARYQQVRQEAAKITPTPPSGKELTITVTNNGKTVSFNMIAVNAGTFMMGATNSSSVDNAHKVTLTKSYYMGETEVTQALWNTVMGTNALWFGTNGLGDNYPVYNVSYNDCLDFIRKLNSLTGRNFRLPTEAEWELAAKGGSTEAGYLYAGSDIASNVARYSSKGTNVVKSLQPNQLGLYDMSGNVQEWCQDYYADYTAEDQTDPTGPASGTMRVMRGGSFNDAREMCTVIHRKSTSPEDTNAGLGLRLALTL